MVITPAGSCVMGAASATRAFAGPVVTDPDNAEFCGALTSTNNTAELSALYSAMLWILRRPTDPTTIDILFDSTWAANVARRLWRPKVNRGIAGQVQRAVEQVLEAGHQLCWHHVRAHKGHTMNELADEAAAKGARLVATRKVAVELPQLPQPLPTQRRAAAA